MESLRKRAFPQRNATRTNAVIGYLKLCLKLYCRTDYNEDKAVIG